MTDLSSTPIVGPAAVAEAPRRVRARRRRGRLLLRVAAVVAVLIVAALLWGERLLVVTLQRYYGGKVDVVLARGTAVKNYLKTVDTTLRSGGAPALLAIAPGKLRPLPACEETALPRDDLPGIGLSRWSSGADACDPWKNLAAHWSGGETLVERSQFKMMHLGCRSADRCEPRVRLMVQGRDVDGRPREDSLYARLTVDFSGQLPEIVDGVLLSGQSTVATGERGFRDEAAARGLGFVRSQMEVSPDLKFALFPFMGGGAAVGDLDGDGWEEIYLLGAKPHESRLYRYDAGAYRDVTERAGVGDPAEFGFAAAMGDVDGDDDLDLIVTHGYAAPTLLRNRGDGTFAAEPVDPTLGPQRIGTTGASLADIDNDGDLDLHLAQYGPVFERVPDTIFIGLNGNQDLLYVNDGSGRFTEEGIERGLEESRWTFQTAFADFDDDGDADFYQVNDFGRNTLYVNDGNGYFSDRTLDWRWLEALGFGMSGCWGDYNVDGRLDLYVSGLASGVQWFAEEPETLRAYVLNIKRGGHLSNRQLLAIGRDLAPYAGDQLLRGYSTVQQVYFQGNQLLRRADAGFDDVGLQTGTFYSQWAWGSGFVDLQNDGLPDVYSTAGFITAPRLDDL